MWKELQRQQAEVFGVRPVEPQTADADAPPFVEPEMIVPPPPSVPSLVTQLLMFGASIESVQRRKSSRRPSAAANTSSQLALF